MTRHCYEENMFDGCVMDSVTPEIGMVDHPNHPLVHMCTFLPVLPSPIDFTAPSIPTLPHHFPPTEFQPIGTGRFCNPFVLSIFQLGQYRGFGFCFSTEHLQLMFFRCLRPTARIPLSTRVKIQNIQKIPGSEKIVPLNCSAPAKSPRFWCCRHCTLTYFLSNLSSFSRS